MKSVSILIVTRGSRSKFLNIQKNNILSQTYSNIIELVLVDGSKSQEESNYLHENLKTWQSFPFKTVVTKWVPGLKLGALRNLGNKMVKGDYIICMDDDDFYQQDYVKHAVMTLNVSKNLIAGCGRMFIYDLYWKTLYQSVLITQNSSVNNCFCYKKKYLENHSYNNDKDFSEEGDFTNGFTEPMEQLDPSKTVVQMVHLNNTYDKHLLLRRAHYGASNSLHISNLNINSIIKPQVLSLYEDAVDIKERRDYNYDIAYYCGPLSIEWTPTDKALGDSEQAVVQLSKEWVKQGKTVSVYGNFNFDKLTQEGVDYINYKYFYPFQNFNVLIIWRMCGTLPILTLEKDILKSKILLVDLHDNDKIYFTTIKQNFHRIDGIMFKSKFHLKEFEEEINQCVPSHLINIIMNGIQKDLFIEDKPDYIERNPYRFCYCSCYHRGAIEIIQNIWSVIVQIEPRAEFHLYYGLSKDRPDMVTDFYNAINNSKGVCDHGRMPIPLVAREKHMSTFHLYTTPSPTEIDCISIRESLVAGCIPLLLDTNVFKERDGFRMQGDLYDKKSCTQIAVDIINLMYNKKKVEELRESLKLSDTIKTWKDIAEQWSIVFNKS